MAASILLTAGAMSACGVVGGNTDDTGPTDTGATGTATSRAPSGSSPSTAGDVPGRGAYYVHLGDSYAAGTGPFDLADGAPVNCMRTTKNPGRMLAARMGWRLHDVTCASATTENLYVEQYFGAGPQLDALGPETEVVTAVLGANNEDFFDTLVKRCANLGEADPTGSPCRDVYGDQFTASLTTATGPALRQGLADIAARAPHARIYAVGYPWVVPASGSCRPALRFADGDIAFAREMQSLLNSQIEQAARSAGAVYVDMSARSEDHDACADPDVRWIEPAYDVSTGRPIGIPAMHPNPRGQRAMANALYDAITR